jgi:transglutaminase-like putative cysteine protease
MAGYLALLSADGRERLRLWGRLVTPWNTGRDEPAEELGGSQSVRALAASGRRIGVAAIVLALFAPLLVPGLHAHKLFHGSGNGSGLGGPGTGQGLPRPLALMSGELKEPKAAPVLTYTTTAPRTDPQNLQVYVLGNLTETDWTFATPGTIYSLSGGQMPPIPGLPNGHWPTVRTTVQFDPSFVSARSYLPLPYPARQVNVVGNWQADSSTLMAYSPSMPLSALSYSAVSDNVDPTPAQLDAAPAGAGPMGAYLAVPAPYRSLLSLARRVTEDATTPGEQAAALQNWFRNTGGFTYSLNAPQAAGAATLRNFLEKSKRGYCQQFAYAMGVLARLLKIPARVVVGYTAGTYEGQGRWSVMSSDAHAWPELYIRGYGWMPFEPTPSGPGVGQATATTPGYSLIPGSPAPTGTNPGTGVTSPGTGTQSSLTGNQRKREQALPIGGPLGGQGRKGDTAADTAGVVPLGPAGSSLPIPLIVVAALLVIALLTPRTRRSLTRRRRWMSARDNGSTARAAWSELLDNLEDYGIRHGPGETPRAVAKRIGAQQRLGAPGREALDRLAQAEERASFAPEPGPAGTLRADVTEVRSAVAASVSKQSRWQARLLPASSVSRTRQTLSHALDAFNWAELALARATRRLLQAHPNES